MDNNAVIGTLTLDGTSLKKLPKFIPENYIKAINNELELNINGVIFTGKDYNSNIVINSCNRNYSKEELIAFQELAVKMYTYPFGGIGFTFGLNILSNEKTEEIISALLKKYIIEHSINSLDSEGHIDLKISDVKDFSKPSFIDFVLELQTLTQD